MTQSSSLILQVKSVEASLQSHGVGMPSAANPSRSQLVVSYMSLAFSFLLMSYKMFYFEKT